MRILKNTTIGHPDRYGLKANSLTQRLMFNQRGTIHTADRQWEARDRYQDKRNEERLASWQLRQKLNGATLPMRSNPDLPPGMVRHTHIPECVSRET